MCSFDVRLSPLDSSANFTSRTVVVVADNAEDAVRVALARYGGIWAGLLSAEVVERRS